MASEYYSLDSSKGHFAKRVGDSPARCFECGKILRYRIDNRGEYYRIHRCKFVSRQEERERTGGRTFSQRLEEGFEMLKEGGDW